ncbi:MAG: putative ABC transporter permease [Kiritimatiellales bacterium]|nr:putative ABC transporter permease [Kiritimatiellales bacterium]
MMTLQGKRVFYRFLLFALLGLVFEVFGGAFWQLRHGNWNLLGSSSPWMMLDYGLLGVLLLPMSRPMIKHGVVLPLRAVVYMLAIFAVEFISGWIFDLCGLEIWVYRDRFNLCGYITATFIPCWYILGLVAEFLHRRVDAMALVLARRIPAEDLMRINVK